MASLDWDTGDIDPSLFLVDAGGRRFYFDDRHLPPLTEAARRTAARNTISAMVRYGFEQLGAQNLPVGNLLDLAVNAVTGWRQL